MKNETVVRRTSPASLFELFSGLWIVCGILALILVVFRIFKDSYPSPLEIQLRWIVFGAAISSIWFGWLGLVVGAIRERLGNKPSG